MVEFIIVILPSVEIINILMQVNFDITKLVIAANCFVISGFVILIFHLLCKQVQEMVAKGA